MVGQDSSPSQRTHLIYISVVSNLLVHFVTSQTILTSPAYPYVLKFDAESIFIGVLSQINSSFGATSHQVSAH